MTGQAKGFTLVELLVTLAMTAIVVASVYGIFGVQAQRKSVEEKSIEMQQDVRVAIDMIARDMRMSGFFGCIKPDSFTNTVRGQDTDVLLQMVPVYGHNNLASGNSFGAKENTDLLILSYADGNNGVPVDTPYMNTNSADIHLAFAGNLEEGDIVLISDCSYTSIFQITQLNHSGRSCVHNTSQGQGTPNPGNWTKDLGHVYGAGSYVYRMEAKYFWVNPQNELKMSIGGFDTTTNTYQTDFNIQTIAENIEDLQVRYGEDSNNDWRPDQWYSADNVPDWDNIIAVQVFLLARSAKTDKNYLNTRTYSFADRPEPHNYNDNYHRVFMHRMVTLRNRTM